MMEWETKAYEKKLKFARRAEVSWSLFSLVAFIALEKCHVSEVEQPPRRHWRGRLFFHPLLQSCNPIAFAFKYFSGVWLVCLCHSSSGVRGLTGLESERRCLPKQKNHWVGWPSSAPFLAFKGHLVEMEPAQHCLQFFFSVLHKSRRFNLYREQSPGKVSPCRWMLLSVLEFYRPSELDVTLTVRSDLLQSGWMRFGSHISLVSTQQNGCDKMEWKTSSALSRPSWLLHDRN